MVSEFSIENQTTLEKVTFGQTIDKSYLYKNDGLDWGTAGAEHSTFSYPGQVGSYFSMTAIKERTITIVGYVYYLPSKEDIVNLSRMDIENKIERVIKNKKKTLNGLVNPNDFIKIKVGDYYIVGKPTQSIKYGNVYEENNEFFCQFLISVLCNNPMFKKETITRNVISGSNPKFHFPLVFPNVGIVMSERTEWRMLAIDNEGDTEVGAKIILEANGDVLNPTIESLSVGQSFTINKQMLKGEKIIVNTNEGDEKGIVGYYGGVESNYFQYWDVDNDWVKLPKGYSLFGFTTADGSESNLDVSIEFNPEKLGLEDM